MTRIPNHSRASVAGGTLHVLDRGPHDAPAIVFLHFFAGSSRTWEPVVARLEHDHRCIVPDLRGFGDSPAPDIGYATADGADDVAALVAALGLDTYALVGHSMGGKIVLRLAARRPSGLRALVLVAPSPPTPQASSDAERARLLASYGDRAAAEAMARAIVARPLPVATSDRVVHDMLRTSRVAWREWIEHGSQEDVTAVAGDVAVPTLVVAGASDPVFSPDLLEQEIVRRVPDARLVIVPDVGHLVPLEAPDRLAALIATVTA